MGFNSGFKGLMTLQCNTTQTVYVFHLMSYMYTTCFGMRPSSGIPVKRIIHVRKISSKYAARRGPPPPFLNVIYKITYYNKICVRSKLKNYVPKHITLLAVVSPFRTDSSQITSSHSESYDPSLTPSVHTKQVRSGGNTYDVCGSNSRREIYLQFMAFLSLSEQIQYPNGTYNHHFPAHTFHLTLH